jgi:hypothetical protein
MNVQVQIKTAEQVQAAKALGLEVTVGQSLRVTSPKGSVPKPCACGECGQMTGGGTWVAGHDAKYKSRLYQAFRSGVPEQVAIAKAELKRLDWPEPSNKRGGTYKPLSA